MQHHTIISRALLVLGTSICMQGALAQEFDNRSNVYGGLSSYHFDGDWNAESDRGWFVGGELQVKERWGLAIEHWDLDTDYKLAPATVDVMYSRIGANYHLPSSNAWQPYVGLGLGRHRFDLNTAASDTNSSFDVGLGVKRFFNDKLFLRGDFKLVKISNVSNLDKAINVGIGYAFGPKSRPAVAAAPAPAPAPAARPDPDSDGDGVVDSRDRCANTPRDLAVDANGCPIMDAEMMSQELMVNFDFDKSDIKAQYNQEISDFADFMKTYSNTSAVIEGHTDSDGDEVYNQGLSERRATAVMNRLITTHGITASRLSAVGFGESRPVVANSSRANKAQNRRIMAELKTEVQTQRKR